MVPCDHELFVLIFKKLNDQLRLMFCEGKVLRGLRYVYRVLCLKVKFKPDLFRDIYFIKHFRKQTTRQTRQLVSGIRLRPSRLVFL